MKVFLILSLAVMAQASFAEGRQATKSEGGRLGNGVERMQERESAEAANDVKKCLKTPMRVLYDLEGTTIVGTIPFNTPNHPTTQICQGVVRGSIVRLVECGI